jgi:hypothetical protein
MVLILILSPETATICTDGAPVYKKCNKMFDNTQHKVVNHKQRFVDEDDFTNHINAIECQNRYLKQSIKCRKYPHLIDEYIDWYVYTTYILGSRSSLAEKMHRFLQDMASVYPGRDLWRTRLMVREEDTWLPSAEDVGIGHLPELYEKLPRTVEDTDERMEAEESRVEDNDYDFSEYLPSSSV